MKIRTFHFCRFCLKALTPPFPCFLVANAHSFCALAGSPAPSPWARPPGSACSISEQCGPHRQGSCMLSQQSPQVAVNGIRGSCLSLLVGKRLLQKQQGCVLVRLTVYECSKTCFRHACSYSERKRHEILRKSSAGCAWNTWQDKQGSTCRCPEHSLLQTI